VYEKTFGGWNFDVDVDRVTALRETSHRFATPQKGKRKKME